MDLLILLTSIMITLDQSKNTNMYTQKSQFFFPFLPHSPPLPLHPLSPPSNLTSSLIAVCLFPWSFNNYFMLFEIANLGWS